MTKTLINRDEQSSIHLNCYAQPKDLKDRRKRILKQQS